MPYSPFTNTKNPLDSPVISPHDNLHVTNNSSPNKAPETVTISKRTVNLLLGISTINAVLALIILFLK